MCKPEAGENISVWDVGPFGNDVNRVFLAVCQSIFHAVAVVSSGLNMGCCAVENLI